MNFFNKRKRFSLVLVCFFFAFSFSSFSEEPNHILKSASDYIRAGFFAKGIEELEKIPHTSQYFPMATVEIIRLLYKTKDWNRFFGAMAFYKFYINENRQQMRTVFYPQPIQLEALALSTLCRWSDAKNLIETYRPLFNRFYPEKVGELNKINESLDLLEEIGQHDEVAMTRIDKSPFSGKVYWQFPQRKLGKIKNPKHLEMDVSSKCVKR